MNGIDFSVLVWIDSAGYHFADFPTFLAAYIAAYQNIYGSDVYLGADSQDGQWITIQAQAAYDLAALGASVYNSFSPATAQGVGLARVVKINGLTKGVPTNSSVVLTLVGVSGTVIGDGTAPNRGIAIDSLGQQWLLPLAVTIPGAGTVDVTAIAQNVGTVNAAADTITTIFTPTLGWQTVNNSSPATTGDPVETDGQLRVRQQNSTNLPAQTVLTATQGALANVVGVTGVKGYENDTDSTDSNGLTPHSICFVVNGSPDLQTVANTIGLKKTPGTNTFGSGVNEQNEIYVDSQGMIVPINFICPAITATINVELDISPGVGYTSNSATLIQAALTAFINQYGIGSTLPFTEFYLPAYLAGTDLQGTFTVSSLEIEKNSGGFGTSNIVLDFDEVPIAGTITVTPI